MAREILALTAALLTASLPAAAHHAIASIYDSGNPIRVEGVVTDFQFVNPHPYVIVETEGDGGSRLQWRLDMDNRYELVNVGMSASTLRKGDRIVASGGPARDKSRSLYVRRLDRPADGFWYEQAGSSPRIGGTRR